MAEKETHLDSLMGVRKDADGKSEGMVVLTQGASEYNDETRKKPKPPKSKNTTSMRGK